MTNEERWIIERMKAMSSFQGRLEELEMHIFDESKEQYGLAQNAAHGFCPYFED